MDQDFDIVKLWKKAAWDGEGELSPWEGDSVRELKGGEEEGGGGQDQGNAGDREDENGTDEPAEGG